MKKIQILIALLIVNLFYSQIKFEKGYFVDNSGKKTECFIKNMDWNYNPIFFEYKLIETDEEKKEITIKNVKEFGIYNQTKFARFDVLIDRTSDQLNQLTFSKEPKFNKETLFLKILVEGNINLYLYNDSNTKRFFYGKSNDNPQQLVYLIYNIADENKISYNITYKNQIKESLDCSAITKFDIDKLQYKENNLERIFVKYNECKNPSYISAISKNKTTFNLSIRPRASFSSLSTGRGEYYQAKFENNANFGLGLEAEFFMPFNKNKWSLILEPQYQYYKAEKSFEADFVSGNYIIAKADYKCIDLPIGIRHYFFLNNKSKFFINASYSFNFNTNSTLTYERNDGSNFFDLQMKSRGNFVFGAGYKHDKLAIELRVNTKRDVLSDYLGWQSNFSSTSIIFGYSIF